MDFASQPLNYGAIMQQAGSIVPDPVQGQAEVVNLQNARIAGQAAQQQLAMQRLAYQRQLSFGADLSSYVQNPTPEGLATLFGKYPEFDKQSAEARAALDRGDITELGSAAALAAKGQYADAAKVIQQRIDGENARGADTSQAQAVLNLLNSGDPAKQKSAVGLLSLGVGIAVGPEKAAEFLKANGLSSEPIAVGLDQRLLTPQGDVLANASPKLENVTNPVTGESTSFNPYTGTYGAAAAGGGPATTSAGGGGPASGASGGGMQTAVATVLGNEGGYNPKDMNGAPTNFGINFKANKADLAKMGITAANFKNMTQDQAAQLYATKYWPQSGAENLPANLQTPYFDVYVRNPAFAKKALAQSGGDPQKFMALASAYFTKLAQTPNGAKYARAWANRDAQNMAIAQGAPAGTQAAPSAAATGGGASVPAPAQVAQNDPYHFGTPGIDTKGAPDNMYFTHDASGARNGVAPIPNSEADPNSYSPGELYDIAWTHLTTGKWGASGGGMGGGTVPQPVQKAALRIEQQIMRERGIVPEQLNGIRATTAGLAGNLNKATQMYGTLTAARENLRADGELVKQKQAALVNMGIIGDHGSLGGLVSNNFENNTYLDWYEKHGSPQQQAAVKGYKDAVSTYAATYGKALSSPDAVGGNSPTSDSARLQANELNDEGMGPTALIAHLNTNLQEMDNKRDGWRKQAIIAQRQLDNIIGPKGARSSQPSQLPPGAKVIGTYQGRRVIQVGNQRMVEQ